MYLLYFLASYLLFVFTFLLDTVNGNQKTDQPE